MDIPPVRDVVEGLSSLIALVAFGNGILSCSGTTFNYDRDHFWTRGIVGDWKERWYISKVILIANKYIRHSSQFEQFEGEDRR